MNTALLALIGVAVLVVSTIGFGATLSTAPDINRIGGANNQVVAAARGNVTDLAWTEEVNSLGQVATDTITFNVGNEDTAAHTFQVCAVLEAPQGVFQPASGQPALCTTTASLAADAEESKSLTFGNVVNVTSIEKLSFSIEEVDP